MTADFSRHAQLATDLEVRNRLIRITYELTKKKKKIQAKFTDGSARDTGCFGSISPGNAAVFPGRIVLEHPADVAFLPAHESITELHAPTAIPTCAPRFFLTTGSRGSAVLKISPIYSDRAGYACVL